MKNKAEVINILKGTLFFFALFFAKNLYIIAKFRIICSTHTLQVELFKMLQHDVFSYSCHHFHKNVKYCGHGTVLKKWVFLMTYFL